MYQVTYLDHLENNKIRVETREDAVSFSTLGVLIEYGAVSGLFIPWHRVTGITGLHESLKELMEISAFPE
jgi:hypothetical protein